MVVLAAVLLYPRAKRWLGTEITSDPRPITPRGDLADFEKTTVDLFRAASASVVYISNKSQVWNPLTRKVAEVESGTGSGFIWDEHGHIVTNYHVIQPVLQRKATAQVVFADQAPDVPPHDAVIVNHSADHDLAVLKVIDAPANVLRPVLVGESGDLQVGQSVFAIGRPFGLNQTLTTGVVSNRSRSIRAPSGRTIDDVIQIDAAINPGNSGGPLLDSAGRLIGVNTAITSPSGASAGIGFAIPVDTVNRIVPKIIAEGRYEPPRIGIHVRQEFNEIVTRSQGIRGIVILDVVPGGPGHAAGLEGVKSGVRGEVVLGDVIIRVGDVTVGNLNELLTALEHHEKGDTVPITILRVREGNELLVDVTLN